MCKSCNTKGCEVEELYGIVLKAEKLFRRTDEIALNLYHRNAWHKHCIPTHRIQADVSHIIHRLKTMRLDIRPHLTEESAIKIKENSNERD